MAKDYSALVQKLKQRTNPEALLESRLYSAKFSAELGKISYNSALEYVRRAMKGVSPEYTSKSKEAGENVKNHLKTVLERVSYEYQGSVMTNTHIMGNSDIDLLVISEKSYYYNQSDVSNHLNLISSKTPVNEVQKQRLKFVLDSFDYQGNTLVDLRKNRKDSEEKLKSVYFKFNLNKPKSIEITNLNLKRDVDVVIAIWHHTPEYITTQDSDYKKITVYDKDKHSTGKLESPFLSINRINGRDSEVNGRLKKMIRFIKNIKCDSGVEEIPLKSFDINAICYAIPITSYSEKNFLELVEVLLRQMLKISTNEQYRNELKSVDGSEFIFRNKPDKLNGLRTLLAEIQIVANDVLSQIHTVKLLRA